MNKKLKKIIIGHIDEFLKFLGEGVKFVAKVFVALVILYIIYIFSGGQALL